MGVYLSAPIVEKESFDEQCCGFNYGASSMQGWRMSQEDAHNCIPDFVKDTETSFFAVYDGHGGAEVAKYCSQHFPDYLKSVVEKNSKQEGLGDLIQSAFLSFDATLAAEEVVKKLKEIAGKDDDIDDDEDPDIPVGKSEAEALKAEADIPIEELLAQYKSRTSDGVQNGELPPSSSSNTPAASSSNGPCNPEESSNENNNKPEPSNKDLVEDSKTKVESGSSSETEQSSSGSRLTNGQRSCKAKAGVGIAQIVCDDDLSDDDDDDDDDEDEENEEEDMWEDCSDDDDDEEEDDVDNDVPMMDMSNEEPGSDSGCTACVVLKQGNKLIVANAGDSRCVLSRSGEAEELSFDHKPEDDPERERIEKAGGKVTADGRVNGGLNLSRAFGDHVYKRNKDLELKEQMISPLPDIKTVELNDKDEFFVVACDGIWNSLSSQEVVDFVRERLADPEKRRKPSLINEELFDHCLAPNILGDGTGCDNMTCIIVILGSAQFETANPKQVENSSNQDVATDKEGQKESLKRVVDNGKEDQAKRAKVGKDSV